jgi:hypothetical protein
VKVFEFDVLHELDWEDSGFENVIVEEVEAASEAEALAAVRRKYPDPAWDIYQHRDL